jgi:hypothetical protein
MHIDIWPPTVLQMLSWPAMANTMGWNLEFIHPHQKLQELTGLLIKHKLGSQVVAIFA